MKRPTLTPIAERVLLLRDAGAIKRSHTCRTLMERNNAEHSHGVAMLVITMYLWAGQLPRAELLAACLTHDLSEIETGDTPAPVKRKYPELKKVLHEITESWEHNHSLRYDLTAEEAGLLFWCDRMEFALYSLEEVTMGNRFFEEYLNRITDWLMTMSIPTVCGSYEPARSLFRGFKIAANHELGIGEAE